MKCRNCGFLANNAVTDLCATCEHDLIDAKKWATDTLGNLVIKTKDEIRSMLHNGQLSQEKHDLYCDLWNVSAYHFSVSNSAAKESEIRLLKAYSEEK